MRNHIERILSNAKLHINQDLYENLIRDCGSVSGDAPLAEQGKYITSFLEKLSKSCGEEKIAEIMQSCGASCIGNEAIDRVKELYTDSIDMADFLQKLNQTGIGGGKLHIDGNKIVGIYAHCYCDLPPHATNLPSSYCDCSAGWYKKLFSSILIKDVVVKKQKTILDGANECTFEIFAL